MMKLYKSQMMILISKKDMYILLSSLLIFLVFLLFSSKYYMDYNYQVVYREELFLEYLIDSVAFMKFTTVIYGIYLSILARKLHHLDGLFLSRSNRSKIIITRLLVLINCSFVIVSILFVLFLVIGNYLTPIMREYDYLQLFLSMQLFGVFYLLLSYLAMLSIKLAYAPIFVLFLYFVGTIFSPYYIEVEDTTVLEKIISYLTSDLIVFSNDVIAPYFGNIHVLTLISVLICSIIFLFIRRDIITL